MLLHKFESTTTDTLWGNPNGNATFHHKRAIWIQGYVVHSALLLLLDSGTLNCWIGPRRYIKDNFEVEFP